MAYLAAPQIGSVRSIVRQTLLCSATFSDKLREIATTGLRSGYSVIDTVGEDVDQTHVHVAQSIIVSPMGKIQFDELHTIFII
jgi:superfamily II DNA/RNA helicase